MYNLTKEPRSKRINLKTHCLNLFNFMYGIVVTSRQYSHSQTTIDTYFSFRGILFHSNQKQNEIGISIQEFFKFRAGNAALYYCSKSWLSVYIKRHER